MASPHQLTSERGSSLYFVQPEPADVQLYLVVRLRLCNALLCSTREPEMYARTIVIGKTVDGNSWMNTLLCDDIYDKATWWYERPPACLHCKYIRACIACILEPTFSIGRIRLFPDCMNIIDVTTIAVYPPHSCKNCREYVCRLARYLHDLLPTYMHYIVSSVNCLSVGPKLTWCKTLLTAPSRSNKQWLMHPLMARSVLPGLSS